MCTPGEGVKFDIFEFFANCFALFWAVQHGRNYKMCDILKTAVHRAKRTKIWASGQVLNVYRVLLPVSIQRQPAVIRCISDFSDCDNLVSGKRPAVE